MLRAALIAAFLLPAYSFAAKEAEKSIEKETEKPAEKPVEKAEQAPEKPAAKVAPEKLAEKEARIKQLAQLLKSFSDEDYQKALTELPDKGGNSRQLASRGEALGAVYNTLAAFEYHKASAEAPQEAAAKYDGAYQRLVNDDAAAVAVRPDSMQETGWVGGLLLYLGQAAINYALGGGVAAGRELGEPSQAAGIEGSLDGVDQELAAAELPAARRADLHYRKGELYEDLAKAAARPEAESARLAKKKARLQQLAALLEAVSDEEYADVLKKLPADKERPKPGTRGQVLRSAYATLAALEYKEATRKATDKDRFAQAYQRVSRDGDLALNPENLQETGWGSNLLHLAELGAIGYLVYENNRLRHKGQPNPFAPPPAPLPQQQPGPGPIVPPPDKKLPPPGGDCPPNALHCRGVERPGNGDVKPVSPPPIVAPPPPPPAVVKPNPPQPPAPPPGGTHRPPVPTIPPRHPRPPIIRPPIIHLPAPSPAPRPGLRPLPGSSHHYRASRVAELYDSLDALDAKAFEAGGAIGPDLHYEVGAVYEQLAAAAIEPPPAPEAPPEPKQPEAPPPTAKAEPKPGKKPEPKSEKPKPAPKKEKTIADEMKEMDGVEKEMRREVERRR